MKKFLKRFITQFFKLNIHLRTPSPILMERGNGLYQSHSLTAGFNAIVSNAIGTF
jgi:hypothetical protein